MEEKPICRQELLLQENHRLENKRMGAKFTFLSTATGAYSGIIILAGLRPVMGAPVGLGLRLIW